MSPAASSRRATRRPNSLGRRPDVPKRRSSSGRSTPTPRRPRRATWMKRSRTCSGVVNRRCRASSNACSTLWRCTTAPRSIKVRSMVVIGMASRSVRSTSPRSVLSWTRTPRRWRRSHRGVVTSTIPGRNPSSPHSAAAVRCDATAGSPSVRHAVRTRWCQLEGAPAARYTWGATRWRLPSAARRSSVVLVTQRHAGCGWRRRRGCEMHDQQRSSQKVVSCTQLTQRVGHRASTRAPLPFLRL